MSRRLRVIATMMRGREKEVLWVRRYAYFDTAMPRAVQLALTYGVEGDIVEFSSTEYGFQLGILRVGRGNRYEMEMNPLVKASPTLLKLMESNL